jgi:hypothetical protein
MPTLIRDVKASLAVAKRLLKKVDVDRDGKVTSSEVKRIKVRDNYTARDTLSAAIDRLKWPDNTGPYDIDAVAGVLQGAISSLERADKSRDGSVSVAEMKNASRVAREFAEFAGKYKGKSVSVFQVQPLERPGTPEWMKLAKREYFGRENEPMNRPYFGTALVIPRAQLPNAGLRAAWDALAAAAPGTRLEATSARVNGDTVYFIHARADARYDVRMLDPQGQELARGVARAGATPNARWSVRWD